MRRTALTLSSLAAIAIAATTADAGTYSLVSKGATITVGLTGTYITRTATINTSVDSQPTVEVSQSYSGTLPSNALTDTCATSVTFWWQIRFSPSSPSETPSTNLTWTMDRRSHANAYVREYLSGSGSSEIGYGYGSADLYLTATANYQYPYGGTASVTAGPWNYGAAYVAGGLRSAWALQSDGTYLAYVDFQDINNSFKAKNSASGTQNSGTQVKQMRLLDNGVTEFGQPFSEDVLVPEDDLIPLTSTAQFVSRLI